MGSKNQEGHVNGNTVVRQFKRSFDESALNELGKATRLCWRKREVTPFRLMLALIQGFATEPLTWIADLHRTFNRLNGREVQYKPFHNQLAKPGFPRFVREVLNRLLNELSCEVLRFDERSPFARFEAVRIQDGTSFGLKKTLAKAFPGRFTTVSPAAVELHVDFDLLHEGVQNVVLAPDVLPERPFLPPPKTLRNQLLLADRGYFAAAYFQALEAAGASFIMRGAANLKPIVVEAFDEQGHPLPKWVGHRLHELRKHFAKHSCVDLTVHLKTRKGAIDCRLIMRRTLRPDERISYLYTNLPREHFTPEQVGDAYRLRWQIELLFKEWKSHANLRAFDTSNPHLAEGLIWASLCAAVLKRYCAHAVEAITGAALSTQRVAKCGHHVLKDILYALRHGLRTLKTCVKRAIIYLASNAKRAHPDRDRRSGRHKLDLCPRHAQA